ncbi:hypothetical protein [Tenggerimyces flavus]|uniref:Transmembrane protein n=1 Tax=Tenggerimyces flavus TaxID=1708749 RepID=A0ABV7YDE2_9ACTN|nr:hypothetical protein [Tenggerimyces flavus]MBM7787891.1 hypothetical protein [Tenggerimyces flavus]
MATPLGEYPTIRLAHTLGVREELTRFGSRQIVTRYGLTSIPVRRPAEGWTSGTVDCETCGLRIDLRVASVPATVRKRWQRALFTLAAAGVAAFFVWFFLDGLHHSATETAGEALLGVGVSVAGFVTGVAFFFYSLIKQSMEDGVRLERPEGHRLYKG